jgi:YidC/Oxa1 family membrane protein insertase
MDLVITLFHLLFVDPMTNVLVALARVFGGNYGLAIIVFTLVMRFLTWPLTASQYKSQRKMQEIQPQIQELNKKYKGKDPKKLQSETMALYKEAGVNPLGCIFPMVVQFPIWIALYQVISVSLGDSPESLITLSQRLYPIPFIHQAVPLNNGLLYWNLGKPDASYVLPFFVALSMYVQQKLITPAPQPGATAQQAQQAQTAQMMTWMMPLMFGFWSLSVPSGLALYWAVSNISGVVMQYFMGGRQMNFKSLLQFAPPSPTPAATRAKPAASVAPEPAAPPKRLSRPSPLPEATDADITADDTGDGGADAPGPSSGRRNKNGRRRNKR